MYGSCQKWYRTSWKIAEKGQFPYNTTNLFVAPETTAKLQCRNCFQTIVAIIFNRLTQCCGSVRYVFEPLLSGYVIICNGSGSFHKLANKVRKTLISTIFWLLLDFLSLKTDVNIRYGTYRKYQGEHFEKNILFVGILLNTDETSRIRIRTNMSRIHNTSMPDTAPL